ncbi:hypothetical protein WJX79_010400 [Trebouxia sp. C0005]
MKFAAGMVQARAIQQYLTGNTLCFDQTTLKSKGAGATLSLIAGQSRRPVQVPHLVRRSTSRVPELQNPNINAYYVLEGKETMPGCCSPVCTRVGDLGVGADLGMQGH